MAASQLSFGMFTLVGNTVLTMLVLVLAVFIELTMQGTFVSGPLNYFITGYLLNKVRPRPSLTNELDHLYYYKLMWFDLIYIEIQF